MFNYLLFIFIVLPLCALAAELKEVELKTFKSDKFNPNEILYFVNLSKNHHPVVLFKSSQSEVVQRRAERVLSYRARFVLEDQAITLNPDLFNEGDTHTLLNRNTTYTKVSDGLFIAKRASFLFDLEFDMKLTLYSSEKNQEHIKFIRNNIGINKDPDLNFSQIMTNYDKFISDAQFHVVIYNLGEGRYGVDTFGWMGLLPEIPNFIQRKMKNDYKEKIVHFASALERVLNGKAYKKKLPRKVIKTDR